MNEWIWIVAIAGAAAVILAGGICIILRRRRTQNPMSGSEFEQLCAGLLAKNGFLEVEITKASGDYGVDVFAQKDGVSWAFQCKRYEHPVGLKAVQEIYSGKDYYHCMVGVVMTNQTFTKAARELAEAHNILLWDGNELQRLAQNSKQSSKQDFKQSQKQDSKQSQKQDSKQSQKQDSKQSSKQSSKR